jgi:hypothetical protein
MSATRTVYWPGKGEVKLTDRDHLATGGEGVVYAKGGFVYKLYLDPAAARARGMADKLDLLARIRHPGIVAPLAPLADKAGQLVGFVMPQAAGVALTRTFANAWRDANRFGDGEAAKLVESMRQVVLEAHRHQALLVDANELNWLAEGHQAKVLDVDSWQVGRYRATAIMPSIRDPHAAAFSEGTDWFSWGIVSFQVLTGIHPYKGTHPDFAKGDLAARMSRNASVFDPKVRLPSSVRDLTVIPAPLRSWYERTFQAGERQTPPSTQASVQGPITPARRKARVVTSSKGTLRHDLALTLPGPIRHVTANGYALYETNRLCVYDLEARAELSAVDASAAAAILSGAAAIARQAGGALLIRNIGNARLTAAWLPAAATPRTHVEEAVLPLAASGLVQWGNRVFAIAPNNDQGLIELAIDRLGERVVLAVKTVWPILAQSTHFFVGCAVADVLGAPYVVAPAKNALVIAAAAPLRGYRVLDAFAREAGQVLVLGLSKTSGATLLLDLVLRDGVYTLRSERVTDATMINAAETENGVRVACVADGELVVDRANVPYGREITDAAFDDGMRLWAAANMSYFVGDRLLRITLN